MIKLYDRNNNEFTIISTTKNDNPCIEIGITCYSVLVDNTFLKGFTIRDSKKSILTGFNDRIFVLNEKNKLIFEYSNTQNLEYNTEDLSIGFSTDFVLKTDKKSNTSSYNFVISTQVSPISSEKEFDHLLSKVYTISSKFILINKLKTSAFIALEDNNSLITEILPNEQINNFYFWGMDYQTKKIKFTDLYNLEQNIWSANLSIENYGLHKLQIKNKKFIIENKIVNSVIYLIISEYNYEHDENLPTQNEQASIVHVLNLNLKVHRIGLSIISDDKTNLLNYQRQEFMFIEIDKFILSHNKNYKGNIYIIGEQDLIINVGNLQIFNQLKNCNPLTLRTANSVNSANSGNLTGVNKDKKYTPFLFLKVTETINNKEIVIYFNITLILIFNILN